MTITIRARREGFRRCGIAHSVAPVTYDADHFGASELDALRSEPMLVIDEAVIGDDSNTGSDKPPKAPAKTPAKSGAKAGKSPAKNQKVTEAK